MYFLLNLSHCVKTYGHFCQILAFFTMPAHQVWPCHVTQEANFENFLFCPNSTFNIGKSHKISSGKAFCVRSYQSKTSTEGGVENTTPPVPLGLTRAFIHCCSSFPLLKQVFRRYCIDPLSVRMLTDVNSFLALSINSSLFSQVNESGFCWISS